MFIGMNNTAFSKPSFIINNLQGISSRTSITSNSSFRLHQFQYFFHSTSTNLYPRRIRLMKVRGSTESVPPPSSTPPSNPFPGLPGKGWIAGLVISLLIPFLRNKWGPLFFLKAELDKDIQTLEDAVEVVEKVAEEVEKLAEEAVEDLPQGKLRKVAAKVEHVAELVAETARLADSAIDKVQELEEEVESFVAKNETNLDKKSDSVPGDTD
ncbi:uncharacterized protein LOC141608258 isoform X2 [Silene latifolia]|uniref:uncharacterized protein LOC141608258 isoform X2 n=1 Tax=Silene latifolia TaxID=37657 RepID=UPI003D7793BC